MTLCLTSSSPAPSPHLRCEHLGWFGGKKGDRQKKVSTEKLRCNGCLKCVLGRPGLVLGGREPLHQPWPLLRSSHGGLRGSTLHSLAITPFCWPPLSQEIGSSKESCCISTTIPCRTRLNASKDTRAKESSLEGRTSAFPASLRKQLVLGTHHLSRRPTFCAAELACLPAWLPWLPLIASHRFSRDTAERQSMFLLPSKAWEAHITGKMYGLS